MGYGESKYIAEQLLEKATTTSGISTIVCRVGQLAGPVVKVGGVWNKQEWLPSVSLIPILWSHLALIHLRTQTENVSVAHSQLGLPRKDPHQSSRPRHGPLDPRRHYRNHHPRPPPLLPLPLFLLLKHRSRYQIPQRRQSVNHRLLVVAHPSHNRPLCRRTQQQSRDTRTLSSVVLGA